MKRSDTYTSEGLMALIDAMPMVIAVFDSSVRVVMANKATQDYVNKNGELLIGQPGGVAFECIHKNDVPDGCGFGPDCSRCGLRSIVEETAASGKAHRQVETTMLFAPLGKRQLRVSTSAMILNNEPMVLLAMEDLTEIKHHEKTQLEKEKLSVVVETAGAVCHEFNQPLQVITGFCELMKANTGIDPETVRFADTIMEAANKMGDLNRKLMQITKYKTKPYLESQIIDIIQSSGS